MNEFITQIGVGGIFAVVVLREVFNFLNRKNENGPIAKKNGIKNISAVSRDEFERHMLTVQYKDNCEQIVRRLDGVLTAQEKRFDQIDSQFTEVKALIRNNGR